MIPIYFLQILSKKEKRFLLPKNDATSLHLQLEWLRGGDLPYWHDQWFPFNSRQSFFYMKEILSVGGEKIWRMNGILNQRHQGGATHLQSIYKYVSIFTILSRSSIVYILWPRYYTLKIFHPIYIMTQNQKTKIMKTSILDFRYLPFKPLTSPSVPLFPYHQKIVNGINLQILFYKSPPKPNSHPLPIPP